MNRSSRFRIAALGLSAAAVVAGCGSGGSDSSGGSTSGGGQAGGSSTSSGASASLDACSVLTPTVASQLAGATVTQHSASSIAGESECVYQDTAGRAGAAAVIGGAGLAATDPQNYLKDLIDSTPNGGGGTETSVSGIGDGARKSVSDHGAAFAFFKGSTVVVIAVHGLSRDGASIEPELEALARQLAGKL